MFLSLFLLPLILANQPSQSESYPFGRISALNETCNSTTLSILNERSCQIFDKNPGLYISSWGVIIGTSLAILSCLIDCPLLYVSGSVMIIGSVRGIQHYYQYGGI